MQKPNLVVGHSLLAIENQVSTPTEKDFYLLILFAVGNYSVDQQSETEEKFEDDRYEQLDFN